jgi:hypothetical protein
MMTDQFDEELNRHRHLIYELDKKQYMLTDNKKKEQGTS